MIIGYGSIGSTVSALLKRSIKANIIGISEFPTKLSSKIQKSWK